MISVSSPNCSQMLMRVQWKSNLLNSKSFSNTWESFPTDKGACCGIFPQLDFENTRLSNTSKIQYSGKDYHSIPKGSRNGIKNGLEVILDVESYDYGYFVEGRNQLKIIRTPEVSMRWR